MRIDSMDSSIWMAYTMNAFMYSVDIAHLDSFDYVSKRISIVLMPPLSLYPSPQEKRNEENT